MEVGRLKTAARQGQGLLDLESLEQAPGRTGLVGTPRWKPSARSLLWNVLQGVYTHLGLDEVVAWVIGRSSRWSWRV